jgi:hypothetical protein
LKLALGIKGLPAGRYAVHWLDCRSGKTADANQAVTAAGDTTFAKPAGIEAECAAWIRAIENGR